MDKKIRYSVVICTKNRSQKLLRLLNLLENNPSIEEIVVVDSSTKPLTLTLASQVRVIYDSDKSLGSLRQLGINQAKADYVMCIDDDVIPHSNAFSHTTDFFNKHPTATAFTGTFIPTCNNPFSIMAANFFNLGLLRCRKPTQIIAYSLACMTFKRKFLVDNHLHFSKLQTGEDIDFLIKHYQAGGKLWYDPTLINQHDFVYRRQDFYHKHFSYGYNFPLLHTLHPQEYSKLECLWHYLPYKHYPSVVLPLILLKKRVWHFFRILSYTGVQMSLLWPIINLVHALHQGCLCHPISQKYLKSHLLGYNK
jgi:glycosyltransferase involved in cell wall biosynthesis